LIDVNREPMDFRLGGGRLSDGWHAGERGGQDAKNAPAVHDKISVVG
jgi:hypothetical protein